MPQDDFRPDHAPETGELAPSKAGNAMPTRRAILTAAMGLPAACTTTEGPRAAPAPQPPPQPAPPSSAAPAQGLLRQLGRTGATVEAFSLGGEGILRTTGREREAVPMVLEALRLGVRYFDTAPAYAQSQDYYGAAFRQAGPGARDRVFMATKTHERSRDGALRLLDDSLRRLGTDHVDLWQLHDLREVEDLDEIFGKGGAIEAVEIAKRDGRVRFVGITGHHDPAILVEAMRRYPVDTVLCAMNPADGRRQPFLSTVVPEARKRGVGVIGMKALAAGRLTSDGIATPEELLRYAASFADTVVVGCSSPQEVEQNVRAARSFAALDEDQRRALEARISPRAQRYDTFKG